MSNYKWICVKCEKYINEDKWYSVPHIDGEHYTHYHEECYINRNNPDFITSPEPIFALSDSKQVKERENALSTT